MPKWKKALYALLAVGAVMVCALLAVYFIQKPKTCMDGIEKIGDECIGVNGQGYDFGTKEISAVAKAMAVENDKINKSESYVTVAMMLPLQSDKPGQRQVMRSDLLGAYLGQRQVNAGEADLPKIRLVLANPGRNYKQQQKVVDTLLRMSKSPKDRLRAVTGFNYSLDSTKQAVRRLTEEGVPVITSRLSGDDIANKEEMEKYDFPGLARIIPTNLEAAGALANFQENKNLKDEQTVLVYDDRPDSYNESLKEAFREVEKKRGNATPAGPADQRFSSSDVNKGGDTGSKFGTMITNICLTKADTIYFAGRMLHLKIFALKLADSCHRKHFTIISGPDAASLRENMDEDDWARLRGEDGRPKVTVRYSAPAHPAAWETEVRKWKKDNKDKIPQYLAEPIAALNTLRDQVTKTYNAQNNKAGDKESNALDSPVLDLDDSRTMLVYDGILTISKALQEVEGNSPEVATPSLKSVVEMLQNLHTAHRVHGTSGQICLTGAGNPYNKPIAVVELEPGKKKGPGTLKFIGLGWPAGKEQPENCIPRSRS